jgi:hypothetical protein
MANSLLFNWKNRVEGPRGSRLHKPIEIIAESTEKEIIKIHRLEE